MHSANSKRPLRRSFYLKSGRSRFFGCLRLLGTRDYLETVHWGKISVCTISMLLALSEAAFSCTLVVGVRSEEVIASNALLIRAYHLPAVVVVCIVVVIFVLRKYKGGVSTLLAVAALALSPGWYASSAQIAPDCGPRGKFGVQVVLVLVLIFLLLQLAGWYADLRKRSARPK